MVNFSDEIIIRDPTGKFKVLRGGKFYDWEAPKKPSVAAPKKIADEILKESGLIVAENLKTRLEEIIGAYLKDVRDKFETKSTLTRKVPDGGMDFSSEQADLIIKLVDKAKEVERLKGLKVERIEKVEEIAAPAPPAAAPLTPPATTAPLVAPAPPSAAPFIAPGVAEFVFSPADEAEILAHQEKLPVLLAELKPIEIAKFVYEIIRESGIVLDEVNHQKLENILLTHLKDVRDGFEIKETLFRAAEPAGLRLDIVQTEKILSVARKKLLTLEEKLKKEALEKIKKTQEEERQKKEAARATAEEKVKEKIEERWQQIAKRPTPAPLAPPTELVSPPIALRAKVEVLAPPAPSSVLRLPAVVNPPEMSVPSEKVERGKEAKVENLKEVERFKGLKVEKAAVPAAGKPAVATVKVEERPKPLEIFKPVAPVRRSIPPKEGRPRIEDVKYVPKLIGPIEELREMTLVDFRRLASNPADAALKIKEKLRLLEKESITKRVAGIKAWQESEVSKLYLEISQESLASGLPASQVIALRQSAGKPILTMEEYQAVLELNRALRY